MFLKKTLLALVAAGTLAVPGTSYAAMPMPVPQQSEPLQPQSVQLRLGFYFSDGNYYYNGHRGYRHHRPGYRFHNGFWFPGFAFQIAPRPTYRDYYPRRMYRHAGNAHVQWCLDRYRSYRPSDNTWQPYSGSRRQCRSPFG